MDTRPALEGARELGSHPGSASEWEKRFRQIFLPF